MVCHEMAFLPPPSSDHHQYFFHHQQQLQDPSPPTPLNMQLSPQHFHGFGAGGHMASLTMMNQQRSPAVSGYQQQQQQPHDHDHDHEHDDVSDDGSHLVLGEKKKRLNIEQVKTLEKNFELGNKLEPERKLQLAKALGLQPRQVAIWFQNRRARWKTKQLEKDYNSLKRQFDALKSHNDSLLSQNKKLQSQLIALKGAASKAQEGGEFGTSINLNATTKSYCWSNNGSEISSDINLGMSTTPPSQQPEEISPSTNKIHFPTSFLPTTLTDLLTTSSNSTPKQQSADHQIQDDSFCSLFGGGGGAPGGVSSSAGGVPEQPPFWAWPSDQHHLQ